MSATGCVLASSTTMASNRSVNPLPGLAHGAGTALTPCSGHATRGTPAWMNALYWKKFRWRHTRSLASCAGHDASPRPASGQWKREPDAKPIVICNSRLQSAPSRDSTPDTLHGSGNCKAAVNNEVVSIPPNYPNVLTANQPSPTPNSERPYCDECSKNRDVLGTEVSGTESGPETSIAAFPHQSLKSTSPSFSISFIFSP